MKLEDIRATLRTFRISEDSFPTIIGNVALLLRTLTINIYKDNDESLPWFLYLISIIGGSCYFYFYTFSMLWLVFIRYSIHEDFVAMAVAISLSGCSLTSVSKFLFMKLHENDIKDIIEKLITFDASIASGIRFEVNLRKHLRVVKKRAISIWLFLAGNAAIYIIIPFLRPGRHFTADLYAAYGLEPMTESPNYEIAQIINNISVAYGVYTTVNVAVYIVVTVGYVEAQFYTISDELRCLWNDSQAHYDEIKDQIENKTHAINKDKILNEYIRNHLRTIVYNHVTNINLFKELNRQFSDTTFVEYVLLCIAIIAELLGGLENTYLQVPYTFVQIYMDCLSGQRLIDACYELENALYSCGWENFDTSNQKTIFLMLLISQRTLTLSAGGVADLNFIFLMSILKSSYSVYTTLKSSIQD